MDTLEKNKFKYVSNMLTNDIIEFLNSYCIKYFYVNKDPQAPLSFSVHSKNSEIFDHLLHYLLPRMESETKLKLKPMYAYTRVYLGGSELKKHLDREQCEVSASITLKYFYKDKDYIWPLCMGDLPVNIKPGDGVIYKGCEIEHWRPVFNQPEGYWHHQVFLHYVDLNGPNKNLQETVVNH